MAVRQRQPREEDPAWLAIVRKMACTVCRRPGPSDPAHLRTGAPQHRKPPTGMGEKSSDCWVLPLCRMHHDEQHRGNELSFWLRHGIADPFALAMSLYGSRKVHGRQRRAPKFKPLVRKPVEQRAKIASRPTGWPKRKLVSRNDLRRKSDQPDKERE